MDLQSLDRNSLGGIRGYVSEMRNLGFARRVSCVGNRCGNLLFSVWVTGTAGGQEANSLSEVRE